MASPLVHRMLLLLALLLACAGTGGRSTALPTTTEPVTWLSQIPTTLVGRVTLDGVPIRSFGIGVIRPEPGFVAFPLSPRQFLFAPPHAIRSVDGRFSVPLMPGVVDLVVSGRGFARTILRGVDVRHGIRSPLEIAVERGQRLAGVVRDAAGQPIGGARIAIEQTGALTGNALHDLANGNYAFTTRADGSFELEGFAFRSTFDQIVAVVRASTARIVLSSHPISREMLGDRIDLLLFPVGAVSGRLAPQHSRKFTTIWARSTSEPEAHPHYARPDEGGGFRFESLPAGDYVLGFTSFPAARGDRFAKRIARELAVRAGVETVVTIP